jgi:hypothetical protein
MAAQREPSIERPGVEGESGLRDREEIEDRLTIPTPDPEEITSEVALSELEPMIEESRPSKPTIRVEIDLDGLPLLDNLNDDWDLE